MSWAHQIVNVRNGMLVVDELEPGDYDIDMVRVIMIGVDSQSNFAVKHIVIDEIFGDRITAFIDGKKAEIYTNEDRGTWEYTIDGFEPEYCELFIYVGVFSGAGD